VRGGGLRDEDVLSRASVLIVVARIDLERRWRHAFHVGGTPIDR
jgi:hypothetical protein